MECTPRVVRRCIATLALALVSCFTVESSATDSSITVVAAGPVTSNTKVEARVSIRNTASTPQNFTLNYYVDSPFGTVSLGGPTSPISVPANGQALYKQWISTAGYQGPNKIRYEITGGGVPNMTGSQTVHITSKATTRAVPLASVGWFEPGAAQGIYPGARPPVEQDVRNALDDAKAIGIKTIVVAYSEFLKNNWGTFYNSPSLPHNTNLNYYVLDTVMSQAAANGQKVILGLGRGLDETVLFDGLNDQARLNTAIAHQKTVASELWSLYKNSPALAGWYIPLESSNVDLASTNFYNAIADYLHPTTFPAGQPDFRSDLPVMVSPSALPTIDSLNTSHVDIFNYQDSVGPGYNNATQKYEYRSHDRTTELNSIFSGYAAKHDTAESLGNRKHLWANMEAWEMDGCNSHPTCMPMDRYGSPYPATPTRVQTQLGIEKNYVDSIMINEIFGFMEAPNRTLGRFQNYISYWGENHTAKNLYSGYQSYFQSTWPALEQSQLVANGEFDSNITGWTFGGNGTTQTISTSTNTPNGTGNSLDLNISALSSSFPYPWAFQSVDVVGGQQYLLSGWGKKLSTASGQLALQVWFLDAGGALISGNSLGLFFSSSTWSFQTGTITAAANAKSALVVLQAQNTSFGFGTGRYLIDYVSLLGASKYGAFGGGQVPEPGSIPTLLSVGWALACARRRPYKRSLHTTCR